MSIIHHLGPKSRETEEFSPIRFERDTSRSRSGPSNNLWDSKFGVVLDDLVLDVKLSKESTKYVCNLKLFGKRFGGPILRWEGRVRHRG